MDLTYTPPVRPPAARGEVRWVYRPLEDPTALAALAAVNADPFQFGERSIFGTTDGGLVVNADADRGTLMLVRPDGTLRTVLQGLYSPVRMTIGPVALTPGLDDEVLRAASDLPRLLSTRLVLPQDHLELPALPGRVRTEMPNPFGVTSQPDPVLLEDGTVIWSPTTHTLFASCVNGGQTRWILEYDGSGGLGMMVRGDAEGGIVFGAGNLYRLSGEGAVLAERVAPEDNWFPQFYSERCGIGGLAFDVIVRDGDRVQTNHRMIYLSGPNLESERTVPVGGQPTADCGVLTTWTPDRGYELSRFDPAGGRMWAYPTGMSRSSTIELSDGSTLIIWEQGERAPGLTIIGPDGAVTLDQELDPAMVGTQLTRSANYLTPDGVLYLASQGDFEANPRLVAIEIGVPPAYPSGDGLDWARTNAAWLTSP